MAATTYFEKLVLDHALLGQGFSISAWFVGLWTANPTVAGLLTGEVAAADYQRKAITFDSVHTNNGLILWDTPQSDWGDVTYVCLLNHPTKGQGNMLIYQNRSLLDIVPGQSVSIPVGGLSVSVL